MVRKIFLILLNSICGFTKIFPQRIYPFVQNNNKATLVVISTAGKFVLTSGNAEPACSRQACFSIFIKNRKFPKIPNGSAIGMTYFISA